MSLLSPLLELSISSRMYRHFRRLDYLGWHFTVKVPLQEIISGQCVFLWDQSCSLVIQVRYFAGLSIVNLIFLVYCASSDIYFCSIVCMWPYWALWDMESYFRVHLLYWEAGLGAAASEIRLICESRGFKYGCPCVYYALTMEWERIRTVNIKSVKIGSSRFFQLMDWLSVSIVYSHLRY